MLAAPVLQDTGRTDKEFPVGFFDRFKRVVKANLNSAISKAENPEKMLNQLITDMNQQLIEVKKASPVQSPMKNALSVK